MDVHLAKDAEQGDPEDEENEVPCPDEPEAHNEGDEIEDGGEGGQRADDLGVHPFGVDVDARFVGAR